MDDIIKQSALIFKAIGDERRAEILFRLTGGEHSASSLINALGIAQPTFSHHMKLLCGCGIVRERKIGRAVYYSLDQEGAKNARRILKQLTKPKV